MKLIATIGCMKCKEIGRKMRGLDIDFEYIKPFEISEEEFDKYVNMAKEVGQKEFPILVKDNEIISVEEVIE